MTSRRTNLTAAAFLLAAAGLAGPAARTVRADVNVEVRSGDKISGTLNPASEHETFQFRVPQGAVLTIKAKALKKGPALHLRLLDIDQQDVMGGTADGKAATIAGVIAQGSGLYSVIVTSQDSMAVGDYSLSITWKAKAPLPMTVELAQNASNFLSFAADAAAKVTCSVKPAKGSKAIPALTALGHPDMGSTALTGKSAKVTLPLTGVYGMGFTNTGATTGFVTASAKVTPPKAGKRKINLTAKVIGSGSANGDFAIATVIGPDGGTVSVPDQMGAGALISGSSVDVPPGALPTGSAIIIGTTSGLKTPTGTQAAGPPVFFGPEGTTFATAVTITIPMNPAAAPGGDISALVIFTRDAKGKVKAVPPPYQFDLMAGTVTFQASHFSSFGLTGPAGTTGGSLFVTAADVTAPEDVATYSDPDTQTSNRIEFLTAEGTGRIAGALRFAGTQTTVTHETWCGGGTSSTDGTTRLQFQFTDPVMSVFATTDGQAWVATTRQIFHVDATGIVVRVAGTGSTGDTGDNFLATAATFTSIRAILVTESPGHDIFVADQGAHRIRNISHTDGKIRPFAGTGAAAAGLDGVDPMQTTFVGPYDMVFTGGSSPGLYVADGTRVRQIAPAGASAFINTTVAGNAAGASGSAGDGGPPTSAFFRSVEGIAQEIDLQNPNTPRLVVADASDHTIRRIDFTADKVTLLAGSHGNSGLTADFDPAPGLISQPVALLDLVGFILYCEKGNGKVRFLVIPQ